MNIDYNKLVQLLLPTFIRKNVLVELIWPMVAQLQIMHSQFNLWFDEARYKANTNASVVSLTELIQREFDVLANIEELDGLPTDFKVNVSGAVEEVRLRSLINQYKIAGRSFTFRVGTVGYSCGFINHRCEDITELYSVEFTDHVCESDGIILITSVLSVISADTLRVRVTASANVTSGVAVSGIISGYETGGGVLPIETFNVTILTGEATAQVDVGIPMGNYSYSLEHESIEIFPGSDQYYTYLKYE